MCAAVGFIIGFALFGSVTYLPIFLQIVKGRSPTSSGLQLTPMMAGLLVTSIVSGRLISRLGRYKPFPVAGTAVMTAGMVLLSGLGIHSSGVYTSLSMLVLGLGLGAVMQVLVLAVQNAVDHRHMGVATSGSLLFRQIGGSIGIAIFGAIFANRLRGELAASLPPGAVAEDREPVGRAGPAAGGARGIRARRRGRAPSGVSRRSDHLRSLLSLDVAPARGAAARLDAPARRRGVRRRCLRRRRAHRRGVSGHASVELDDRAAWRRWLRDNHASSPGIWLVTWKKSAGKPRVDYDAAVEEALCFGWVDSRSRTVDDSRTSLLFTPRTPASSWSGSNAARVEKLETARLMRAAGRRAVEEAKRSGRWPG